MPYFRFVKFERNWSMRRVSLVGSKFYFYKTVWRRKMWRKWDNFQEHISCKLLSRFPSNLVWYMEGIKYVNLLKIDPVVIEIRTRGWKWRVSSSFNLHTCAPHVCWYTTVCPDNIRTRDLPSIYAQAWGGWRSHIVSDTTLGILIIITQTWRQLLSCYI